MVEIEKNDRNFYSLVYCQLINMDPLDGETDCDMIIQNQVFEPLFEISPDTLSLEPLLVTRYSSSSDFLKYTIELKEGIFFHDGTSLDADDVLFTFERIAKERPQKIYFLNTHIKESVIPGIKKLDKYTLEFHLARPSSMFLTWLADPFFSIIPKSQKQAVMSGHFKLHPVGSGAFKWVKYSPTEGVELVAFDRHHLGCPEISKLHFPFLSENEAKRKFLEGELDQLFPYRLSKDELKKGDFHQEVPYRVFYTIEVNPVFYPHPENPFLSLENRQVFRQALNVEVLHKKVDNEMLEPANNLIPRGLLGYSPIKNTLLSSSQMSNGLSELKKYPIRIGCSSGVDNVHLIVDILKENLRECGLKVDFIIDEVKLVLEGAKNGIYLATLTSNFVSYPDPLFILEEFDIFGYSSKKYFETLNSVRHETDRLKRAEIYKKVDEHIYNDVAVISLFHGANQKGLFSKKWNIPNLDFVGELFMKYRKITRNQ